MVAPNSPSVIYLITGANRSRGIGLALVQHALEKHENAFVYAGARDPDKANALHELKEKFVGRLEIVKCVSGDSEGNAVVAKQIEERHGRVDTVIANAAIWNSFTPVSEVSVKDFEEHFHVNTTGPIVLFQSMLSLLKKSISPRFISVSSIGGCIGMGLVPTQAGAICYGASKAALNWATRKIHFENDWLVAFPLSPGGISTDMVTNACNDDPVFNSLVSGVEPTAAEAAVSILKVIDEATREEHGGEFIHLDGTKISSWKRNKEDI
ncbi:putative oxidoreductase C24B10.20 [Psilocybe cubensis]|uniref:Oxidoreductase C24B10.20 n=2 Tax=Psilocybe cubensis TaxID=181762 RepID=A0ACB8GSB3_PSICU|nr:putative oxidoreductase C24B10.20 [Psilocybe cubensis]KAH9478242.1 putative oxidoreductase C24B10.20 [Psilocybe cubensis]